MAHFVLIDAVQYRFLWNVLCSSHLNVVILVHLLIIYHHGELYNLPSLTQEGKAELYEFTHPDPYCVPFMPGGSLFMRNPPPPLSICFPDGNYPADAPKYTLNPDMSICRPETGKSAVGGVLVDFGKKNME